MLANIKKSIADGVITAPPSKSMAHRLLICAGLSDMVTTVNNVAYSEDILATLNCLKAIGAEIKINGNTVVVKGVTPDKFNDNIIANCRESGSTLRFFIPILLLCGKKCTLVGSKYLFRRPLDAYREICDKQGISFDLSEGKLVIDGALNSDNFYVKGNVSSQFISGLLFALPLLENNSVIHITPPIESRSYIDMTVSSLKSFGVEIVWTDDCTLFIKGNQRYAQDVVAVEGDFSNAAFYEAFNRIGGKIEILGLNKDSLQGDRVYSALFDLLDADKPIIDITDCPDLAPILITVATLKNGAEFIGTKRLEIKESNRGVVMAEELARFGADIKVYDNKIVVNRVDLQPPTETLSGHNDHRVVMSLAVIASLYGGTICGVEAVNKSFPDFFEKIKSLGIRVELDENK